MDYKLDRALSITGWMSGPELNFLAEIAHDSKSILEIGSYHGRSTRALADNTKGQIQVVDPWDGDYQVYQDGMHFNGNNDDYGKFHINLWDHIKSGRVKIFRGLFEKFVTNTKYDFIFIDAIHEYDALLKDIEHARKFITNGILAGHDYYKGWPGVIKAVDEVFPNARKVETIWYTEI